MTARAVPTNSPHSGVSAVKINGTVVYAPTDPDPLDALIVQARPEHQKSPTYKFHDSVGFLNRTVNGQPLTMMRELELALQLNDPISADQIRSAAAAAAKKPPTYDQLQDLRKHFAKEIQRTLVETAAHERTTFVAVEKPLLPAIEHPSFETFSLAATIKQLGKGAKYSAGTPAMKNMDAFLRQFFKYTEVVRQIETVKVSEIQKGLDSTRAVLAQLAASLTPNQQELLARVEGEIEHQQAEINMVASLADGVRLMVPQIALSGVTTASGSLDPSTMLTGINVHMSTLVNASDAQRARTATQLSFDMNEKPKRSTHLNADAKKTPTKVSDSSTGPTDDGAAKGQDKSPVRKMPPPSPRTPPSKRKGDDTTPRSGKKPKPVKLTPADAGGRHPPKAGTPSPNPKPNPSPNPKQTPTGKGKGKLSGSKGSGGSGKGGHGNRRDKDPKAQSSQ